MKGQVRVFFSAILRYLPMTLHPCTPGLCLFAQSPEYKMPHGILQDPDNKVLHTMSVSQ